MRKPIIAGNWKMNNSISEAIRLVSELKELDSESDQVEVVVAPSFVSLHSVSIALQDTNIKLAAQNMSDEESGAYTGEISAAMLKDTNCEYVILGHSERRQYFHEKDEFINRKVIMALEYDLIPILCVGETLEQRNAGITATVVETQIKNGLKEVISKLAGGIVIAYEPVWAIGTGKTATPEQAENVHLHIREVLKKRYNAQVANEIRILYGGSVNPDTIKSLMEKENVDGGLVGGASLDAKKFARIVKYDE
jgi:triosephosphate isomerase